MYLNTSYRDQLPISLIRSPTPVHSSFPYLTLIILNSYINIHSLSQVCLPFSIATLLVSVILLLKPTRHLISELFASGLAINCKVEFSKPPEIPIRSLLFPPFILMPLNDAFHSLGSARTYVLFTYHKISPLLTEHLKLTTSFAGQLTSDGES